jgi:hypothetical protein
LQEKGGAAFRLASSEGEEGQGRSTAEMDSSLFRCSQIISTVLAATASSSELAVDVSTPNGAFWPDCLTDTRLGGAATDAAAEQSSSTVHRAEPRQQGDEATKPDDANAQHQPISRFSNIIAWSPLWCLCWTPEWPGRGATRICPLPARSRCRRFWPDAHSCRRTATAPLNAPDKEKHDTAHPGYAIARRGGTAGGGGAEAKGM